MGSKRAAVVLLMIGVALLLVMRALLPMTSMRPLQHVMDYLPPLGAFVTGALGLWLVLAAAKRLVS